MGLDMYLHAKRYVSSFDEQDKELAAVIKAEKVKGMDKLELRFLVAEALYWRKANHIHHWFVINVQDGEDDCGHYHVSREKLTELLNVCHQVLADKSKAADLLPLAEGFFFGGNTYEDWYFEDVKFTITHLEELLSDADLERWDFEYHSSW